MSVYRALLLSAVLVGGFPAALAQANPPAKTSAASGSPAKFWTVPHTVTTHGSVTVDGHVIHYTAKAGTLILRDTADKPTGEMFYVAYFKDGAQPDHRPIAFLYNGGPGGSSAPLHIGAFGPVRVVTLSHTHTPPAPYRLINNQYSLLDVSDLVFVDAMGTGFSRIIGKADGGVGTPKMFYGVDADGKAFTQFITGFLSQYGRWNCPKYLIGESYGTTRSAVVAGMLENSDNIDLNGIVLLSTILNFDTSIDQANLNPGVNLPYALAIPTYAAVAWYHKRLAQPPARLHPWLDQVQAWAMGPYLAALNRGSALPGTQQQTIAAQMAGYTGLSEHYLLKADLRVTGPEFEQQLLSAEGKTTGRLDARFSGPTLDPLAEYAEYDPLLSGIGSAYVSAANEYLRHTLHFGAGHRYVFLSATVGNRWKWAHTPPGAGSPAPVAPNVLPDLAATMTLDPNLKVLVNAGYFDLATPYYAAVYQMRELPMQPGLEKNVEFRFYHTGHMIYVRPQGLAHLHANIAQFIRQTE
jgi:carboxypeptidase C (cathepsin A)